MREGLTVVMRFRKRDKDLEEWFKYHASRESAAAVVRKALRFLKEKHPDYKKGGRRN